MTKKAKITLLAAIAVIIVMLVIAGVTGGALNTVPCPDCDGAADCETCGGEGEVIGSFWALIPPVIAIGLALITKEVYSSLFIGIIAGALLAANFSPAPSLDVAINSGLLEAVSGTAGIFISAIMHTQTECMFILTGQDFLQP